MSQAAAPKPRLWTAFRLESVFENHAYKAESVASWGQFLVIGTSDGTVLVYEVSEVDGQEQYQLRSTQKAQGKKTPITQLAVLENEGLLVALSDSVVCVYDTQDIKNLTVLHQSARTKGCHLMAVNTHDHLLIDKGAAPEPILLAVAIKRKLVVQHWDRHHREFVLDRETTLAHTPKAMCWLGRTLVAGFNQQYLSIDADSLSSKEIFSVGAKHMPMVTRISATEVLLHRDTTSSFHSPSGAPSREYTITWSDTPQSMALCDPYIVCATAKSLEVRLLATGNLVQTLEGKNLSLMVARPHNITEWPEQPSGGVPRRSLAPEDGLAGALPAHLIQPRPVIAASTEKKLFRLHAVAFADQVREQMHSKLFTEALELARWVPEGSRGGRGLGVDPASIHREYALHLFERRKFEKAIQQFMDADAPAFDVLALFPHLLLPAGVEHSELQSGIEAKYIDVATEALIPFLVQKRSDANLDAAEGELVDTTLVKCYLQAKQSSLLIFLRLPNIRCNVGECEQLLTRAKRFKELVTLYHTKKMFDRALKLLQTLVENGTFRVGEFSAFVRQLLDERVCEPKVILHNLTWAIASHEEQALELCLYSITWLDPTAVHAHLKQHRPSLCIVYLERLLLPFLKERERELEMERLRQQQARAGSVRVAPPAKENKPERDILTRAALHNELVLLYVERLKHLRELGGKQGDVRVKADQQEIASIHTRLQSFLRTSPFYADKTLLPELSSTALGPMHEEKAIVLGRIGHHDTALATYAHHMGEHDKALAHCELYYSPDNPNTRDIFLALLKVYLSPPVGFEPKVQAAVALLSKHGDKIDTMQAIQMLPPSIPLASVLPFLSTVLQRNSRAQRENHVTRRLLQADHARLGLQLNHAARHRFKLDSNQACAVCNNRIGESVFALYPNDVAVHYSCMRDKHTCPATGKVFNAGG